MRPFMNTLLLVIYILGLNGDTGHCTNSVAYEENIVEKNLLPSSKSILTHKRKRTSLPQKKRLSYGKIRDRQIRDLTIQSEFVQGEVCAKQRWVNTLDIFCTNENLKKRLIIPAEEIHKRLAYIGNHLRAFSASYPEYSNDLGGGNKFKRNILVPHVSFVVSRGTKPFRDRQFVEGGYLNFDKDIYPNAAMAFISGINSMPWEAIKKYNQFRRERDDLLYDLPFIRVMAGKEVGSQTKKTYKSKGGECCAHTEELFYDMFLAHPNSIARIAQNVLKSGDKIKHVVFDFYSWWDVCKACQSRFREEYFKGTILNLLKECLEKAGLSVSKVNGASPVFRVSSYAKYHPESLDDITRSGGGRSLQTGFDAKVVSQSQVILCTRKTHDEYDYEEISKNINK